MLWILPTQSVDQRAERGKTAAALEGRPLVLVEELVVDVELRVNIGGVHKGDVVSRSLPDCLTTGKVGGIRAAPEEEGQRGTDPAHLCQEFAPAAHGPPQPAIRRARR